MMHNDAAGSKLPHKLPIKALLAVASLLVLCAFVLSLFLGKYPITAASLWEREPQAVKVFMTLRLPRTCMGLLGGFILGVAGNVYQTIFHNPLASPDIIGVASGASAGAAFSILFLSSQALTVTVTAFAGGLSAVVLSLALSSMAGGRDNSSIVLAGIAVNALAQTVLMILKMTADPEKELASIEYWIMGSLNGVSAHRLLIPAFIGLGGILGIFLLYRQILALSVEEEEARMLGVAVGRMRLVTLLLATLVTASVISVTGLISFIGLLAPHTARLLTRNMRFPTLVLSGLMGSLLLSTADMLARSVSVSELPVSIFTSLLGAPFLVFLLIRRNRLS